MRLLMLSADSNIFKENSAVRQRMIEYAQLVEELHIIVYTKDNPNNTNRYPNAPNKKAITANAWIYSTNTRLKPFYFWDAYKIAKYILSSDNSDKSLKHSDYLVTAQDPFETGLVGYPLKKKFKIPLELQAHTDFLSPYFAKESLKNKIRVLLAKFLIKKADRLRVVSDRIKKSVISQIDYPESKIEVRPIFVDVKKIKKSPIKIDLHRKYPSHNFIILVASRLSREKNIGLAIEAFNRVKRQASSVGNPLLLIVGDGPERQNLKFKIENLKLQNNAIIEPWTDDLISYYKTADLFLLTSNYEGYGLAAVEAAAAGLPVVMTDVGAAIGRVVPVGDKKRLIEVLEELIANPAERRRVIDGQNNLLKNWPTKQQYLDAIKKSWQDCYSSPKK